MSNGTRRSITLLGIVACLWVGLYYVEKVVAGNVSGPWSDSCHCELWPCFDAASTTLNNCRAGCNGDQNCLNTCQANYNAAYSTCSSERTACISGRRNTCYGVCNGYCGAPAQGGVDYYDPNDNQYCSQGYCMCTCCIGGPPLSGCICVNSTWQCYSPILIDISGRGFHMTDAAHGVTFNLTGDGAQQYSWTAQGAENGWLVLDRNGNGVIDDGTELFGNMTPQPLSNSPNGYLALAVYDDPKNGGNGDGYIDDHDAIYSQLRIWVDRNHDGISQPEELLTLPQAGIRRIDLHYQLVPYVDQYKNVFALRARVFDMKGHQDGKWAWDVYIQRMSQ